MSDRFKRYRQKLKLEVLTAYGRVCSCCGEAYLPFLTLDHILGGGTIERKTGLRGTKFYQYLRRNNFPRKDEIQVLCWNCNAAAHMFGGVCPCAKKQSQVELEP